MTENEVAKYIYDNYDPVLTKVILASPSPVTSWVMAGIIHRESAGGLTLSPPGPAGTGDGGHGRGLCQIDDRYYPKFCESEAWKDPEANIALAKEILENNYHYFVRSLTQGSEAVDFEKIMMIACSAYNAGIGGAKRGLKMANDSDHFTTGGNYGSEVMRLAKVYNAVSILEQAKARPTSEFGTNPASI